MATPGFYQNPSHKSCFEACSACFRCKNYGRYAKCNSCSGKHDPFGVADPDPEDFCDCANGLLRFRNRKGQVVKVPYKTNPFKGKVAVVNKTEDEEAWDEYVHALRERLDNPTWDPVQIVDYPASKAGEFKYLGTEYPH